MLSQWAADTALAPYAEPLQMLAQQWLQQRPHGDLARWQQLLAGLPAIQQVSLGLDRAAVTLSSPLADDVTRQQLQGLLQGLHPWRKGPFDLFGVHVDSEWRSNLKWDRLLPHIQPLQGRVVLDVGCGNGYYAWRMLGQGARLVLGIDPTLLFLQQFEVVHRYAGPCPLELLPLGIEQLPPNMGCFDSVFSMGVFYHRRSPFDHLAELRDSLRRGGELVLETLVIEGGAGQVLVPADRYAKMRNVWFLPSVPTLVAWLQRSGFKEVRCVDVTSTTPEEQRSTPWMRFESLSDYLWPGDPSRTIEGYPAPRRAILLAERA